MSISRLRPDGSSVLTQTIITTLGVDATQVFDLGQIRSLYLNIQITATNLDTLTLGSGPGTIQYEMGLIAQSRDGITYHTLTDISNSSINQDGSHGAMPLVMAQGVGITARYVSVEALIFDNTTGATYAGARNPTGTYSMFLEYV